MQLEKAKETKQDMERCRLLAQKGAAFLEGHCLTEGPRAVFLVDRQGHPKEAFPGAGLCPSAFADCFAAMGLAAWAEPCRLPEPMDAAWGLFQNAVKLAEEGRFPTAPDQLPDGWRSQAVSMIRRGGPGAARAGRNGKGGLGARCRAPGRPAGAG